MEVQSQVRHLQQQCSIKEQEIISLKGRKEHEKDQIDELMRLNQQLKEEVNGLKNDKKRIQLESKELSASSLASQDQQISRLKQQVQQLLEQERMKQEEVSRCRAQVASLSAELAVERQMVEETRHQLALTRASQNSFPHLISLPQKSGDMMSDVEFLQLPSSKPSIHM